MQRFLIILSSVVIFFSICYVGNAADPDYIQPSFNCSADNLSNDEDTICNGSLRYPGFQATLAQLDNLFSSYYNYAMANAQPEDKANIRKIANQMIKNRKSANTMTDEQCLLRDCYECYVQQAYINAVSDLTDYLYTENNGRYKQLVENIFKNKDKTKNFIKICHEAKVPEIGTDNYSVGDESHYGARDLLMFLDMYGLMETNGALKIK